MTDTTAQGPTADLFDHVAACIRQGHATDAMAANVEFLKGEFLRAFRSIDNAVAERTDELRFENSIWSDRIDELTAERNAMEARARESALDALAAYGQAAEAHTAQLAAEAKLATARGALADLVSWFDGGPSSHGPWIIASGDHGADDAVAVARALARGGAA